LHFRVEVLKREGELPVLRGVGLGCLTAIVIAFGQKLPSPNGLRKLLGAPTKSQQLCS
jgi:hypothetical protein